MRTAPQCLWSVVSAWNGTLSENLEWTKNCEYRVKWLAVANVSQRSGVHRLASTNTFICKTKIILNVNFWWSEACVCWFCSRMQLGRHSPNSSSKIQHSQFHTRHTQISSARWNPSTDTDNLLVVKIKWNKKKRWIRMEQNSFDDIVYALQRASSNFIYMRERRRAHVAVWINRPIYAKEFRLREYFSGSF